MAASQSKTATSSLFTRNIAGIFVPLIPALCGSGIVAGISSLASALGLFPSIAHAIGVISSGFSAIITVFVGYNTAKVFGGTPIVGGAIASVIVSPSVTGIAVLGNNLSPGEGGVICALLAGYLGAQIENLCRRWVPSLLSALLTPSVTILVSGLITLYGLMYASAQLSVAIGHLADWLLKNGGVEAGFILGSLFLPMVVLGLHQALIPIHTTLIEQHGYTVLLPMLSMGAAGQVGAAIATYLRLGRNTSIRSTIKSTLLAGFLGIVEPLIYDVSLPLVRPFITACVGGGFGGAALGLLYQLNYAVGTTGIGPSGWALFPLLKGDRSFTVSAAIYASGLFIGYAAGFFATYCFGFSKRKLAALNASTEKHQPEQNGVDSVLGNSSLSTERAALSRQP